MIRELIAQGRTVTLEGLAVRSTYLTASIQRFGEYAPDEIELAPEAFDGHVGLPRPIDDRSSRDGCLSRCQARGVKPLLADRLAAALDGVERDVTVLGEAGMPDRLTGRDSRPYPRRARCEPHPQSVQPGRVRPGRTLLAWSLARYGGAGTVALGSAVISYGHVQDVLAAWGYSTLPRTSARWRRTG